MENILKNEIENIYCPYAGYLVRRVCACLKISQVRFAINVRVERANKNAKIEQFHQEPRLKTLIGIEIPSIPSN